MPVEDARDAPVAPLNGGEPGHREFVRRRPAPPLRPFVAFYSGYREVGVPPRRHRGLPSPYLTLIVTLHEPLVVAAHPDPVAAPGQYDSLLGGLHTRPALIVHDGRQSGMQLGLTVLGARMLLGLPAGDLAGMDLDAAALLGNRVRLLRERLLTVTNWPARFAVLDEELLRLMAGSVARDGLAPELGWAWRRLRASGGQLEVAELAREVGWSERHLRQRFRGEFGLSPKQAARVIRFDRTRMLLQRLASGGQPISLAELAARFGYYDQAHLAAEFRALAGAAPSRWLAEEFRFLQALRDDE